MYLDTATRCTPSTSPSPVTPSPPYLHIPVSKRPGHVVIRNRLPRSVFARKSTLPTCPLPTREGVLRFCCATALFRQAISNRCKAIGCRGSRRCWCELQHVGSSARELCRSSTYCRLLVGYRKGETRETRFRKRTKDGEKGGRRRCRGRRTCSGAYAVAYASASIRTVKCAEMVSSWLRYLSRQLMLSPLSRWCILSSISNLF